MLRKIIKEPLVHFAMLGMLLFFAYAYLNPTAEDTTENKVIVTKYKIEQLDTIFQKKWRRSPTVAELKRLIDDYIIESDDVFVCSIGNVSIKKNIIELICAKGGEFISLIHPNAFIGNNAKIGTGCIVLQNATIGVDAELGDYVLVQISAIIGHDTIIGDFSRIDCFAICVGGVVIQRQVTLHTAAIINHNVIVGMNSIIGAGSFVIRKVKENTTVFGNPAVRLK